KPCEPHFLDQKYRRVGRSRPPSPMVEPEAASGVVLCVVRPRLVLFSAEAGLLQPRRALRTLVADLRTPPRRAAADAPLRRISRGETARSLGAYVASPQSNDKPWAPVSAWRRAPPLNSQFVIPYPWNYPKDLRPVLRQESAGRRLRQALVSVQFRVADAGPYASRGENPCEVRPPHERATSALVQREPAGGAPPIDRRCPD